jgi:hypothetical protein
MRTTLTLEPDVAALLKKVIAAGDVSFKDAVNSALRRGLTASIQKPPRRFVQRLMPPGDFQIDINDNAAIWELFDREDYGDLSRREPPDSSDGSKGE